MSTRYFIEHSIMNNKVIYTLFAWMLSTCFMYGQIMVKSFKHSEQREVLTGNLIKKDNNNVPCALIRVLFPYPNVQFGGNTIGEPEFKTNEYWVYLTEGSKKLKIQYPHCQSVFIDLSAVDEKGVQSKVVYELIIDIPKELVESSVSDLDAKLNKAIGMYKEKKYDEAYKLLINHNEELKTKGVVYQKVNEWINRCRVAHEIDKLCADTTYAFSEGVCRFSVKKKMGFIDSTGTVIMQPILDYALDFRDDVAWVKKDNLWGCINKKGSFIVYPQYDKIFYLNDRDYTQNRCLLVLKDDYFGLVDIKNGEVLLPLDYWTAHFPPKGASYICLETKKGKQILIDLATGTEIVKLKKGLRFERRLCDDYFVVENKREERWIMHYKDGIILEDSFWRIDELFDTWSEYRYFIRLETSPYHVLVYNLQEKRFITSKVFSIVEHGYGDVPFVTVEGKDVIFREVEEINKHWFKEEIAAILNLNTGECFGHTISRFNINIPFNDNSPMVVKKEDYRLGNGYYLYDQEQNEYKAPASEIKIQFHDWDHALIRQDKKYGIINNKGEIVIPCEYDDINTIFLNTDGFKEFREGRTPIVMKNKNGTFLFDYNLHVYEAPPSEIKMHFDAGYARIRQDNKYGFINMKGEIVIPCKYYDASPYFHSMGNYSIESKKWSSITKVYLDKESYEQKKPLYLLKHYNDNGEIVITETDSYPSE